MVIMQHARILYRQRTPRGLRSSISTTIASTSGKRTLFSSKVKFFFVINEIVVINMVKLFRLFGNPQPRTLYFLVEAKSRVREVYAQTCHHFSKQGMLDTELFGLAVLIGEL